MCWWHMHLKQFVDEVRTHDIITFARKQPPKSMRHQDRKNTKRSRERAWERAREEAEERRREKERTREITRLRERHALRKREEHTLRERQSWGPSNDGGLRMVNWESQSKTPPQSPEDGHIYCILLIRVAFCHVSENLQLHCLFYVTMNIYFCFLS